MKLNATMLAKYSQWIETWAIKWSIQHDRGLKSVCHPAYLARFNLASQRHFWQRNSWEHYISKLSIKLLSVAGVAVNPVFYNILIVCCPVVVSLNGLCQLVGIRLLQIMLRKCWNCALKMPKSCSKVARKLNKLLENWISCSKVARKLKKSCS
jgi:hypothetical protein